MTSILKKSFLVLALMFTVLLPRIATADSCTDLKNNFPTSGISQNVDNLPKYCTVESVYQKVINLALYAIGIVAVIMVIYGGYIYMTAAGNEEQRKKGRTILTWAIVGLIVVLGASALVNAVVTFVVGA